MATTIPGIAALAAYSPRGDRSCTTNPDAAHVDISDRPYFQQATKDGKFVNSGYIVGRTSGAGTIAFVHPVLNANGDTEAILILPVTAVALSATLNDPLFPAGTVLGSHRPRGRHLGALAEPRGLGRQAGEYHGLGPGAGRTCHHLHRGRHRVRVGERSDRQRRNDVGHGRADHARDRRNPRDVRALADP